MSDQPETLAAVLAAMRRYADIVELGPPPIGKAFADLFREYADRIEAAAERDEDRRRDEVLSLQRTIVKMQDAIARQADAVNAAAMREALTAFVGYLTQKRIDEVWAKTTLPEPGLDRLVEQARAALAAPARNCERFQNWHDAMREEYFTRSTPENVKGYPYGDEKRWREFCDWLFAPAEGGDHA